MINRTTATVNGLLSAGLKRELRIVPPADKKPKKREEAARSAEQDAFPA
jgi:hypothetical protein